MFDDQNSIRITIVTPSYNQAKFLEETICSVLSQDYPNLEYIVIDGGSSDNSVDIIRKYKSQVAYWVSEPDLGQTHAINKGLERATGDLIAWLNSDDTFVPDALVKVVDFFQQNPHVDIVFGDTLFTKADGTPIKRTDPQDVFDYTGFVINWKNCITQPSAFIRRSVVEAIGLLDPHYYFFMDWDYWLRAGIQHRITFFPQLLSTYRLHENSKSVSQSLRAAPELEYMYNKYFARDDVPQPIRAQQHQARLNMYFTTAAYYIKGKAPLMAARMGFKAVRTCPELLFNPSRVHQLFYCLFGGYPLYDLGRMLYKRTRFDLG